MKTLKRTDSMARSRLPLTLRPLPRFRQISRDRPWIEIAFGLEHPGSERLDRIARQHRHGLSQIHRSSVVPVVDQMNRCARNSLAALQHRLVDAFPVETTPRCEVHL